MTERLQTVTAKTVVTPAHSITAIINYSRYLLRSTFHRDQLKDDNIYIVNKYITELKKLITLLFTTQAPLYK